VPSIGVLGLVGLLGAFAPVGGQPQPQNLPVVGPLAPTQPGGVQRLAVTVPADVTRVTATLFDAAVPLGRVEAGRWEGLLGVDVERAAGEYALTLTATTSDGRASTRQMWLVVGARRFPTRRLTVDGRFIEPTASDAARMRDDATRLSGVLAGVSERRWAGAFLPPVRGVATSNFGTRSVFNGQPRAPHAGIDYRGAVGTPITAPNAGRVALAQELFLTGNTVVLDHGLGLFSVFAHLSRMDVRMGQDVVASGPIGLVGATGRVTGPHLHWSVRLAGARIDPALLLQALTR
jgi:murein DD-endopeptidase MepM/ murein hydrolase activator NlpD